MPYSGGSYSLPVTSWNPAVASTTISATDWNTTATDLSTALSTCLLKDGTQTATALIPFAQSIRVGVAGSLLGYVDYAGNTSGTTRLQPAAIASGTLTLPATTDTLVGRATTDTLTNKSISGSTNTITNISLTTAVTGTLPVANGGTGITAFGTGVATALGQNVTGSGGIVLQTSASLTTPTINTAASVGGTWTAAATWTLPSLTLGGTTTLPNSGSINSSGQIGIGGAPFCNLHVQNNSAGGTANVLADEALFSNTTDAGITIYAGTGSTANIFFGSSSNSAAGQLRYNNSTNTMTFGAGGATQGQFTNAGVWSIGAAAGSESLRVTAVASANRWVTVLGSNGSNPSISASGGELSVGTNAWTFGTANVVSPTSPNRTLTVTIGGTTYYIAAKTTND